MPHSSAEASWDAYVQYALHPTTPDHLAAIIRMAFLSGRLYALSDVAEESKCGCMADAWERLILEASAVHERQAAVVNKLRVKFANIAANQ